MDHKTAYFSIPIYPYLLFFIIKLWLIVKCFGFIVTACRNYPMNTRLKANLKAELIENWWKIGLRCGQLIEHFRHCL